MSLLRFIFAYIPGFTLLRRLYKVDFMKERIVAKSKLASLALFMRSPSSADWLPSW